MMRLRSFAALAAVLVLALPSIASADDGPTYPVPPKPDFSGWKFLIGTWTCSTQSSRRSVPLTSTETWSIDPNGYYLVGDSDQAAVPWFPTEVHTRRLVTYDADAKTWGEMDSSDVGGYYLGTSTGWVGNTLTWHDVNPSYPPDVASSQDMTVTKVSDTNITTAAGFTTKSGKTVTVTGGCTKPAI